jgi:hypothetical protein
MEIKMKIRVGVPVNIMIYRGGRLDVLDFSYNGSKYYTKLSKDNNVILISNEALSENSSIQKQIATYNLNKKETIWTNGFYNQELSDILTEDVIPIYEDKKYTIKD